MSMLTWLSHALISETPIHHKVFGNLCYSSSSVRLDDMGQLLLPIHLSETLTPIPSSLAPQKSSSRY